MTMRDDFYIACIFAAVICAPTVWGEERGSSISDYDDCAEIKINLDSNVKEFTAAEKTALMDEAFYESLAKFDRCQTASGSDSGGSESGSFASTFGEQAASSEDSSSDTDTMKSVASASVLGMETTGSGSDISDKITEDSAQSAASLSVSSTKVEGKAAGNTEKTVVMNSPSLKVDNLSFKVDKNSPLDNGKLPEDIPPSDNDSALQAQIRAAAIAERDPKRKAALWNEYRKHKGLSQVEEKPE